MDKQKLIELAERLEAATGRDAQFPSKLFIEAHDAIWPDIETGPSRFFGFLDAGAYLDAAMTLVPEGWRVRDLCEWETFIERPSAAWTVELIRKERQYHAVDGAGRTPALALAAASLRARAA